MKNENTQKKSFFERLKTKNGRFPTGYFVLFILFCLIFIVSAVLLLCRSCVRPKNKISEQYYNKNAKTDVKKGELAENPINFKDLQAKNAEVIGWIRVPSTEDEIINYPILQSSFETEEDFYINHDIDKKYDRKGSIYIQREDINSSDFSDFNTVIYGHNMMNKSMFGTLKKYRNTDYFKNNRTIYIYTPSYKENGQFFPGHIKEYKIVSAFIFDDRLIPTAYNHFLDDEKKQSFIDVCKSPNTLVKNVADDLDVTVKDHLITLSTCTSAETERYLVVAKLVKDTETK
ncbi:MAG TPA: hypothetical protein DEW35_03010 [Ruminococcaceae bacterium]|nr:hypothetical protein [Oscillospiraceae bacterium]